MFLIFLRIDPFYVVWMEKADLAIRDKEYGATPLGWARYAGRQEAVEFLRSLGARTE
jgi:hypothetical protein